MERIMQLSGINKINDQIEKINTAEKLKLDRLEETNKKYKIQRDESRKILEIYLHKNESSMKKLKMITNEWI